MLRKAMVAILLVAAPGVALAAGTLNPWVPLDLSQPGAQTAPAPVPQDPITGLSAGKGGADSFAPRPTIKPVPIGNPNPVPIDLQPATTAVPEPGTLALLALGLIGAGAGFHRRRS